MSVEVYLSGLLKTEVGQIGTYDVLEEISKIWNLL